VIRSVRENRGRDPPARLPYSVRLWGWAKRVGWQGKAASTASGEGKFPDLELPEGRVYVDQVSETRGKKAQLREESLKHRSSTHDYDDTLSFLAQPASSTAS